MVSSAEKSASVAFGLAAHMSSASWAIAASDSQFSRAEAAPRRPDGGRWVRPIPVSTCRTESGSESLESADSPRAAPRSSTSAWRTTGRS